MSKTTTLLVELGTNERLDVYLGRFQSDHSRAYWQSQIAASRVLVNAAPTKASHHLNEGDVITIEPQAHNSFEEESLPIIYEDDDVVVINKPFGILTHAKGAETEEFTVAEFMRPRTTDGVDTNRPGIVHRLDRATSGVIITAKNSGAKSFLQKQFQNRKVKKTYIALVEGQPKDLQATINLPIERNPKKPQTFRVSANGKSAETAYETIQAFKNFTLLRLYPLTGRTHQLRVHLHYLHLPIVGDRLYGREHVWLGRLFLHAESLEVTLPSRVRQAFTAPLPDELEQFLTTLDS